MGTMASQITSLIIVYSTVYSGADQRKHQSSASLAFVRGIHRWPVNSPHKWPVTRKMFPFDDVMLHVHHCHTSQQIVQFEIDKFAYHVRSVDFSTCLILKGFVTKCILSTVVTIRHIPCVMTLWCVLNIIVKDDYTHLKKLKPVAPLADIV